MKGVLSAVVIVLAGAAGFLSGCGSELACTHSTRATIGYTTAIRNDLISLPRPEEKIVVAVYKFRDQTGQYKVSATATTFSTAVTQGATSMLIKALEDSGWFIPIEREGLPNLLNERKIIRSTRMQFRNQNQGRQTLQPLPPLLYAGVLLEGGIIAYETNLVTGGFGVRYFGLGGSAQLRRDQVTIYLRAVSVKSGKILKSVSTTKSVLSREVDFGIYRFVRVKRLLEVEAGMSTNEPPQMCVLEAIEKAVYDLIIEGIQDGVWDLKNPEDINSPAIQKYLKEKQQVEKIVTFDKKGNLKTVEDVKEVKEVKDVNDVVNDVKDRDADEADTEDVEDVEQENEVGDINDVAAGVEGVKAPPAEKKKAELLEQIERKFENPDAYFELGQLYQAEGLWAQAEYHYNIALGFDPAHWDTQAAMIKVLANSDNTAKAELYAEIYMSQAAGSAATSLQLGLAFQQQQLDEYALACYQQALNLVPNSAKINRQIGYYNRGKDEKKSKKR